MKSLTKRITAALTVAVMAFTAVPFTTVLASLAEVLPEQRSTVAAVGGIAAYDLTESSPSDFNYSENTGGGITITKYKGTGGDVVIPAVIEGKNVASIGSYAFEGCTSLMSVTIPDSVTSIGSDAFFGCTSLMSVTIPDSVTSIGSEAFLGCTSLTSIEVNSDNISYISEDGVLFNKEKTKLICYPAGKTNNSYTIPDSVQDIDPHAFEGCTSLTSVTIPDSVIYIEPFAFSDCTSLTSITIPRCVTTISGSAFQGCTSLTSVTISDSVTSIGNYAFLGCTSLTSIEVNSDNISYISEDGVLFNKEKTKLICYPAGKTNNSYTILDSVKYIDPYAFRNCTSLTSVTIPNGVTSIGHNAFNGCTSLTSVIIPDGVTSIETRAFSGCTSLTSVTIPGGVTSIGSNAFYGCASLTSVTIPDSVKNIDAYTFYGCTSLTSVTIPNSVTYIGFGVFQNCTSLTSVTIPNGVTSMGDGAFYGCTSLTSVTIPGGVTSIGRNVFSGCTSLTSVTIPGGVTSIGSNAFYGCTNLTSVTIPNSVTYIDYFVFQNCTSLTSITIPGSVTSIGSYAFLDCPNVTIYCYSGSLAETYAIENGIKYRIINGFFTDNTVELKTSAKTLDILVSDENLTPIEGATVILEFPDSPETDSMELTSGADGFVHAEFDEKIDGRVTIKAFKEEDESEPSEFSAYAVTSKYNSYESTTSANNRSTVNAVLTSKQNPYIRKATVNGIDITNKSATINSGVNGVIEFSFDYVDPTKSEKPVTCEFTCGTYKIQSLYESAKLNKQRLISGKPLYVRFIYANNTKSRSYYLNVNVISFTPPKNVNFNVNPAESLTIPDEVPVLGGFEINLDNSSLKAPVILEINEDSFKVGVNLGEADLMPDKLKKKIKEAKEKSKSKIDKDFSFEMNYALLLEVEYNSDKPTAKGLFILNISAGAEFEYPIVALACTAGVSIGGGAELEVNNIGFDFNEMKIITPEMSLELAISLGLSFGVGLPVASIGIYGAGTLAAGIDLIPKTDFDSLTLSGEFGAYEKFAIWEFKQKILSKELPIRENGVWIWDADKKTYSLALPYTDDYSEFTTIDRSSYSAFNSNQDFQSFTETDPEVIQNGAYTGIVPQIVTCGDTVMMMYVDNNIERDDYNFPTLVYRIYDSENNVWGEAKQVVTDPERQFVNDKFSLYSDGEEIYVAYTEANRLYTQEDGVTDILPVLEIHTALYDAQSDTFTGFERLTNNTQMDSAPLMTSVDGKPAVLWISNADGGNIYGTNETNTVTLAVNNGETWETTVLAEDCNAVVGMNAGELNGEATAVLILEGDNDLSTVSDRKLYTVDLSTCEMNEVVIDVQLTEETEETETPERPTVTGTVFYQDDLYINIGADLVKYDGTVQTIIRGGMPNGDFDIFTLPDDRTAVVCKSQSENGTELYALLLEDDALSNLVRLTETDKYIDGYSVAVIGNKFCAAFTETEVTFNETDFTTESVLKFTDFNFEPKLEIGDIDIDVYELGFSDDATEFTFEVINSGMADIDGLKAQVIDDEGNIITEKDYADELNAGTTAEFAITAVFPVDGADKTYKLVLLYSEDNTVEKEIPVNVLDFEVESSNPVIGDNSIASVTVSNTGYVNGGGTLYGYDGSVEDSRLLIAKQVEELLPGEYINYQFNTKELQESGNITGYMTFVFVADETEEELFNNSKVVNLFMPEPYVDDTENFTYNPVSETEIEITGYTGTNTDITIPDGIGGMTVISIAEGAFSSVEALTSIIIPACVTNIDEGTFVKFPNLVIYSAIGSYAAKYATDSGIAFAAIPVCGDVNDDGKADAADVIEIKRYLVCWEIPIFNAENADVNNDDEVNDIDVVILKRHLAGWDVILV